MNSPINDPEFDISNESSYQTQTGVIFKKEVTIFNDGITWKDRHYLFDEITYVRWGYETRTFIGMPLWTDYIVAFGEKQSEAVINLRSENKFSILTTNLWIAVCIRLVINTLISVSSDEEIEFGDAIFKVILKNNGITLVRQVFRGKRKLTNLSWGEVKIWSSNGSFYIAQLDNNNNQVRLPYIGTRNVVILERILQEALKKPGIILLSELIIKQPD